jgi:hypothetical protein
MQAARRLRAAPLAPLTELATIRTQTRELLHETFEAARVRSRRALMSALRARVQLIHRLAYQPARLTAMGQAEQLRVLLYYRTMGGIDFSFVAVVDIALVLVFRGDVRL